MPVAEWSSKGQQGYGGIRNTYTWWEYCAHDARARKGKRGNLVMPHFTRVPRFKTEVALFGQNNHDFSHRCPRRTGKFVERVELAIEISSRCSTNIFPGALRPERQCKHCRTAAASRGGGRSRCPLVTTSVRHTSPRARANIVLSIKIPVKWRLFFHTLRRRHQPRQRTMRLDHTSERASTPVRHRRTLGAHRALFRTL